MRYTYDVSRVAPRTFVVGVKNADDEEVTSVEVTWWREKWSPAEPQEGVSQEIIDGAVRAVEYYIADNQLTV